MDTESSLAQPKVFIETFGCQMNVLDSELVQGQLEALGYAAVATPSEANVVLLNTCSVRELSEQKVWSQLGRLGLAKKAEQKELIIGVLGCMAEREGGSILKRMPHVDVVCGPSNLDRLPMMIENARIHGVQGQMALSGHTSRRSATLELAQDGVETMDLSRAFSPEASRFQAYVRITRGCNKFCSFCVVPYVRGPEVHRPPQNIVEEVQRLVAQGAREVTLIGQTVNHYVYKDGGVTTSFADLLWRVHEQVPELPRLRFLTSYPRDFGDDALDVMASASRICKYLHVPAQSGSNAMLKAMNRGYTVEEYEAFLSRARAKIPDLRLAGDMIVGFPGETDEDHQASIGLLKRAQYKSCFVFKYSPREGTVAHRRFEDSIPEEVKKQRNYELLDVQSDISLEKHRAWIGRTVSVLVEGEGRRGGHRGRLVGRTEGDEIVAFDGPKEWIGSIIPVRVLDATPLTLLAEAEAASIIPDSLRSEVSAAL